MWHRIDKLDNWVEDCVFKPLRMVYGNLEENPEALSPEGKQIEKQVRDLIKLTMRGRAVII